MKHSTIQQRTTCSTRPINQTLSNTATHHLHNQAHKSNTLQHSYSPPTQPGPSIKHSPTQLFTSYTTRPIHQTLHNTATHHLHNQAHPSNTLQHSYSQPAQQGPSIKHSPTQLLTTYSNRPISQTLFNIMHASQ